MWAQGLVVAQISAGRPAVVCRRRSGCTPASSATAARLLPSKKRARNAAPITSARSRRLNNATVGNNTCVTRHDPHRPRRGRTTNSRPRPRNVRRRANPQGRSRPTPQASQPYSPATSLNSTRTASRLYHHHASNTSQHQTGPLAIRPRTKRGGPCARGRSTRCPPQPHHRKQASPSLTAGIKTSDASGDSALRTSGAQQGAPAVETTASTRLRSWVRVPPRPPAPQAISAGQAGCLPVRMVTVEDPW
jgi:hypothetical protein